MLTGKLFALISCISLAFIAAAQTASNTPIPVYKTDGTPVPKAHIVVGSITVPAGWGRTSDQDLFSGIPVTLAGAAAFTSAETYSCFVSQPLGGTSAEIGLFRKIDGSHFAIRALSAARDWRQDFICIGN